MAQMMKAEGNHHLYAVSLPPVNHEWQHVNEAASRFLFTKRIFLSFSREMKDGLAGCCYTSHLEALLRHLNGSNDRIKT